MVASPSAPGSVDRGACAKFSLDTPVACLQNRTAGQLGKLQKSVLAVTPRLHTRWVAAAVTRAAASSTAAYGITTL